MPRTSYVERVLSAVPGAGAGARVDRAVTYTRGRYTFVALVTDVGFGTWVVEPGVGVFALDEDASGIKRQDSRRADADQ